jgi:AraC-like DNA-binding protein
MHLQAATPDHRLAPFVRCFAHRETIPGSCLISQAVIGSLEHILSFDLCDRTVMTYPTGHASFHARTYLMGSQTRYAGHVCLSGHVVSFGIFLRPFALWQLFGIPPAELADVDGDATAILGSWVAELWHKLACAPTFSSRMNLTTDALLRFVRTARPLTSIMSTVHLLSPSDETARITNVAHRSAMSIRSYERQFAVEIGMSPKQFARVARFAGAIDLKRKSNHSWLNIAHDLGYFDQMHMIRDFRTLGGDAPGRLVHPESDFQPWSAEAVLV